MIILCPLVNNLKKEYPYEPFNILGPFLGILNEEYIRDLIDLSNGYGLDTLYLGYILGTILEGIYIGKVSIKDLNKSLFDFNNLDKSSEVNL